MFQFSNSAKSEVLKLELIRIENDRIWKIARVCHGLTVLHRCCSRLSHEPIPSSNWNLQLRFDRLGEYDHLCSIFPYVAAAFVFFCQHTDRSSDVFSNRWKYFFKWYRITIRRENYSQIQCRVLAIGRCLSTHNTSIWWIQLRYVCTIIIRVWRSASRVFVWRLYRSE